MSTTDPPPEPSAIGPPGKKRIGRTELRARIEVVLFARLAGGELWDLVALAREKEWKVSKRQLQRYSAAADRLIEKSLEADRGKLLRRHQAQRRRLFSLAIRDKDLRAALAIVQDEAELQGLYPKRGVEVTGANGAPLTGKQSDAELAAAITSILGHFGLAGAVGPAAPGPGGDPADSGPPPAADGPVLGRPGIDLE